MTFEYLLATLTFFQDKFLCVICIDSQREEGMGGKVSAFALALKDPDEKLKSRREVSGEERFVSQ